MSTISRYLTRFPRNRLLMKSLTSTVKKFSNEAMNVQAENAKSLSDLIPRLQCEFPSRIHNFTDDVAKWQYEFCLKHNLFTSEHKRNQFIKHETHFMTARVYPYDFVDGVRLASEHMTWLFLLDDFIDEGGFNCDNPRIAGELHPQLMNVMKPNYDIRSATNPFEHGLYDLWQRLCQVTTTGWQHRFRAHFDLYMRGMMMEGEHHHVKTIPTLVEYFMFKPFNVDLRCCYDFVEVARGVSLPEDVMTNDIVWQLNLATANIVAFSTDIYGCLKKFHDENSVNLVHIIKREHQLDWKDALDQAVQIYQREMDIFNATLGLIPSFGEEVDTKLADVIEGYKLWIKGNLHFMELNSKRYLTKFQEAKQ